MTSYRVACGLRFALAFAAFTTPSLELTPDHAWRLSGAAAQTPGPDEKQAFDAAKELGTVEAWDAFLSNYPKGFHADLARAYLKKLSEAAPASAPATAATAPPPPDDFPVEARSWGGVVRDGPGQNYRRTDSLNEGEPVTLMARTDVVENGYPWFKIAYQKDGSGFQWGGILCAIGNERSDVYKICPAGMRRSSAGASDEQQEKTKPNSFTSKLLDDAKSCGKNGGEWDGRRCRPAGYFGKPVEKSCKGRKVWVPEAGRCVDLEAQEDGPGDINGPAKKKKKKKKCPGGQYLNQNGVCQPNETGA